MDADVNLGATSVQGVTGNPLLPGLSCLRLTCGDGDPTEEEMGSRRVDWAPLQKKVIDAMPTADDAGLAARGGSDRHDT